MKVEIIGFNPRQDEYKYTADGLTKTATTSRLLELQELFEAEQPLTNEEMALVIARNSTVGDLLGAEAEYPPPPAK